ncbi:MAG: hypothetical protein ACN6O6_22835 [Pseudomonas sp.]|uniref:hypothetical protein n=1 Tax=Pseudomonas sp. TaxID=306 RepID=UPI003D099D9A
MGIGVGEQPGGGSGRRVWRCLVVVLGALVLLASSGCARHQSNASFISNVSSVKPTELFQTPSDRLATLAMRNNLNALYRLMDKLYLRNPREWRKTGLDSRTSAARAVQQAIESGTPLAHLGGREDVAALSYALGPDFEGDRVGAFIFAIGSMLVTAHGGRTEFYLTDMIDPQFVHNAARNIEKATWMLASRQGIDGKPLLLSNEITAEARNLSFAVEFGKIVARLDLLTNVLDERYRRIGVSYAQGLLFINFLPVQ